MNFEVRSVSGDDYDAYIAAREKGMIDRRRRSRTIGQPGQATSTHPFDYLQNGNVAQSSGG